MCRPNPTGVGQWVEGLVRGLVKSMPDTDFVFFHLAIPESKMRIAGKNVQEVVLTQLPGKLFRLLYVLGLAPKLEQLLGVDTIETVIFPEFYAWPVRTRNARIYAFIPDTTYLDVPQYVPHRYFRWLLHKGVSHSTRVSTSIVVCSEATKRSINAHYGYPLDRIVVAYPGYEPVAAAHSPAEIDVPDECILFVGTLEPRKNIAHLIQGYVALPHSLRKQYPLILAGGKGWLDSEITELIQRHAEDGVRAVGYVSASDRERLYEAAVVFAYPVRYEGFGMPIIEAQAHGVPVLATRNSSLPEATGTAAQFCETSVESISEQLKRLLEDPKLRTRLSRQGKTHAATFTWARSQKILVVLIQKYNR